jgi:hypothetical protein
MGLLDAITADVFPRDSQGRIVLAPYGRRGKAFILPAEWLPVIRRLQRRYFQALFVAVPVATLLAGPWGSFAVFVLWTVGQLIGIAYVTKGLEESIERPTVSRSVAVDHWMRAMGRPTMWAICVAGALTAGGGAWLLSHGQRGIASWFLALYGTLVCLLYASKLYRTRGTERAT